MKNFKNIIATIALIGGSFCSYGQDMYVGSGSNLFLGSDAVISVSSNFTTEENISGLTNGYVVLIGNSNTNLNMKDKSIHGLGIQKNTANTVTLIDSFSVNNLYLTSGKLLLGNYTGKVNVNMNNNAMGIINTQGTGSLKFNYTSTNTDTLYLDQSIPGATNLLKDLYVRGNANIVLKNYVNIKRLAYIGNGATLTSDTINPYIRMIAIDSLNYGQLQFESGAMLNGKGASEMLNNHQATYIHIGTPYTGSTYSQLTDDVTIFFNGSGGKANQWNLFTYNEALSSKTPGIGMNSFWNTVANESDAFTRGRGHALYTWAVGTNGISLPTAYPNNIDVSGNFTTANFIQSATYTTTLGTNADSTGWHIVSNPYYCNIKVPTLPTGIQGQTFNRYQSEGNGTYKYVGYNTNTNTAINGGSQYVAPLQAMYYQATSSGATVTFDPSWQESTPSNNYNQWKTAPVTDQIRLTVQSNSNKNTDEAIIGFMGNAQDGFANEDARKVNNGYTYPNIYTYAADNRLSFNYLNIVKDETTIPVGFSAYYSGSYSIKATNEEQDQVNTIILEDKTKGTFTNLSFGGNYTFDHDAKNTADRFVLHLNKANSTNGIQDITSNSFYVYSADNNITINFENSNNENVTINIYDILGREMVGNYQGKINNNKLSFSTNGWASAYYFVNVKTNNETKTIKVLVK